MTLGVPGRILGILSAIPRQMLPDNLVQWRIDQDPSVPCGQLRGSQDVGALDDVRLVQLDRLMDQMPTEGLPLGIPLWISQPVEVRLVLQHLPEVRIVIESTQRELQLARQRLPQRRLASAAGAGDKDMLLSTALHLAFVLLSRGAWSALEAHRITSSARIRRVGGIVIPSAFAVLRLRISSYFVGCSTGRAAGLAPFRILST